MKTLKLDSNVLLFLFNSPKDLSSCFSRVHESYEGAKLNGPLKGINFSVDFYNSWVTDHLNDLSPDETLVQDLVKDCKYIIGCIKGDSSTLHHEWAHANYYLNPKFREIVKDMYEELPGPIKKVINLDLKMKGYSPTVIIDEFQAYVIENPREFGKKCFSTLWPLHLELIHRLSVLEKGLKGLLRADGQRSGGQPRKKKVEMMQPQIIILKEGTDTSQGKGQLLSNISACETIANTVRTTLGPRGMDKLMVDSKGGVTISNDGATILKLLDVVHPAGKALVDVSRAQDAEVGDGTTSVTLLSAELLKQVKHFVEDGVSPQLIMKGFRKGCELAVNKIKEIAITIERSNEKEFRSLLEKCAATAMSSKLIHSHKDFFTKMVVDAVLSLDQEELNENLIGIKKVPGGAMEDSLLVAGVAFKKTFSYAGFEQQPKSFTDPKILCLNVELELKAERDNAEVRIERVDEYQSIVDAEWSIIYDKLEKIVATGAKVVLSKLPIGDLATQYFADRDIFCAGRVATDDLNRVVKAVGGAVQTSVNDIEDHHLGNCKSFEEVQIGSDRYNLFVGCPMAKTCTLVLRGGAEQFIAEVERSLHDAIMIVRRAIKNKSVVAGGGATEMVVSSYLRQHSRTIEGKQQMIIAAMAKALEIIPRQLCDNAGFDATDILNQLRQKHSQGPNWFGVDMDSESIADNFEKFVWEPALVKINCISAATEAACLILSVDETVRNAQSEKPEMGMPRGRGRGGRGRGRR